jgi:uncharacterized protein
MPPVPSDVQRVDETSRRPDRGRWRAFAETRGWVGGYRAPALTARLRTDDDVQLAGSLLPGPSSRGVAILVAHGFGAHRRKPAYARLSEGLATVAPTLALDLRGHGRSHGRSTFGDREVADVTAGVRWLTASGFASVVLVGVSMGATAVLGAAATTVRPLGVVVISGPARFRSPAPPGPLQRLERLWHSAPRRRLLALGLGVRLAAPAAWRAPASPVEAAATAACPILVVHGDDDVYFPTADGRDLAAAAGSRATLWPEPAGFGHAEDGLAPAFVARLATAVERLIASGRFPPAGTAAGPHG